MWRLSHEALRIAQPFFHSLQPRSKETRYRALIDSDPQMNPGASFTTVESMRIVNFFNVPFSVPPEGVSLALKRS